MRFTFRLVITVVLAGCLAACGGGKHGKSQAASSMGAASQLASSQAAASQMASSVLASSIQASQLSSVQLSSAQASSVPLSSAQPSSVQASSAQVSSTQASSAQPSSAQASSIGIVGLTLSNPNATPEAVSLFEYLKDSYKVKTLTGQQESTWMTGGALYELNFISSNTGGKAPAILGLDYLNHRTKAYRDGVTKRAADWYLVKGGIPTICWHWGVPTIGQGYDNSKLEFDIDVALTPGTPENLAMIADLDLIAVELAKLQTQGVPVLWRPFHEFSGSWFWWGGNATKFKKMWIYMYNYYTVTKGLNNLIWVLGYSSQGMSASYYPGNAYVDVAGTDTYVHDHGSLKSLYTAMVNLVGTARPIVLHENGPIPDPDNVVTDSANWSYFMTWHTTFVDGTVDNSDPNYPNHVYNTAVTLTKAYNHEHYITLDELPNLPNY
jgi:mannan endo-1,4-beta-mannosidase